MTPAPVFVPPRLAITISRARLTALLAALRAPVTPGVLSRAPRLELARALFPVLAPPEFAEAVDLLDRFSSAAGAAAIADASRAARRRLPLRLPAADLAAVLLTRRATDPSYESVLERALHAFARIVPRRLPLELAAREPKKAGDASALMRAIEEILGARFVDAWHAADDAGALHVAVVRRAPRKASAVASANVAERRVRRDLVADVLRIDAFAGRVVVRCADGRSARSLEGAYAKAIGASLFGDESFFADAPAYTLKPIVLLGSAGLAAQRPPGVSRVRVVDITWDDGEGTTLNAHGSDALAAFERAGGAAGGYATGAMFRLDAPASIHPIDVTVRLPDRALYRDARHEALARAALASLGALSPGTVRDDAYTLAPFLHAEWRWRKILGDALFDAMVSAKTLVRAKTRMVGDPAMGKYGWSYVAFDLRTDPKKKYAVAMSPGLPSRDLEADERRMWRLDPAAVAAALSRELGAEAAPADSAIDRWALDLGVVRGPEVSLRFFALLRAPGPATRALAASMMRAAGASHVVVFLPEGRTFEGGGAVEIGLTLAELCGHAPMAAKVFGRVGERKGIEGLVEAWRLASPGTRFVTEEKSGRMWLDRCELSHLPESASRILRRTAAEGGRPVPTSTLVRFVSPNRGDDGVVRQTVRRLGDWLRAAFAAKGLTAPADLDDLLEFLPNKGWRLKVKCEVR